MVGAGCGIHDMDSVDDFVPPSIIGNASVSSVVPLPSGMDVGRHSLFPITVGVPTTCSIQVELHFSNAHSDQWNIPLPQPGVVPGLPRYNGRRVQWKSRDSYRTNVRCLHKPTYANLSHLNRSAWYRIW